jgi:hypothetical protein
VRLRRRSAPALPIAVAALLGCGGDSLAPGVDDPRGAWETTADFARAEPPAVTCHLAGTLTLSWSGSPTSQVGNVAGHLSARVTCTDATGSLGELPALEAPVSGTYYGAGGLVLDVGVRGDELILPGAPDVWKLNATVSGPSFTGEWSGPPPSALGLDYGLVLRGTVTGHRP